MARVYDSSFTGAPSSLAEIKLRRKRSTTTLFSEPSRRNSDQRSETLTVSLDFTLSSRSTSASCVCELIQSNLCVGSSNTWGERKSYINSWWKPNITRGYLYLDRTPNEHLPWPIAYPPYRIYSDNSRYAPYNKHAAPFAIRMISVIEETFAEDHGHRVRWYVMTDDDTVLLIDNLVSVLSKYDHTKYYYVGMNSECVVSNFGNSFQMAFGGAGYALSYPLAQAVAKNMDTCIKSYPNVYGSDHMLQACIADLGVTITLEKGFHQVSN
ncbi:uncharacterized protein LOC124897611 [Capsicum annuum]|uniref:uncharacterized protein LOC124897611 n=1 Tax=Capsicum annuum TaxID=4072 RepID=UPI001FB15BC3|nr:uncharacterized protein LOC124897611 [Capsicum annuum]